MVLEKEGLFANLFDGDGYIYPVEAKEGAITQMKIEVNYKDAYYD